MRYRPEIDGLRAVAVLSVILFHAGVPGFEGGFVGVDIFFVISGYLITSILMRDLAQGNFSFIRFYERRVRRILPALIIVLLACLPFAWVWMLPRELEDFGRSLVAVVLFASNILFWRDDGYFVAGAEQRPLLHTWSLSVEEQFYLLFPLFLWLVWRRARARARLPWLLLAVAAASLILADWGARHHPSGAFYLAPTRAWELLAGSLCAVLAPSGARPRQAGLAAAGLVLILAGIFTFDATTPVPGLSLLLPVAGTALIVVHGGGGGPVTRLLSHRGAVGLGLISYSAYLWHQPLFAFARMQSLAEPPPLMMAALIGATLLLAWMTWAWVERPVRRHVAPVPVTRRGLFGLVALACAAFAIFGGALLAAQGFDSRFAPGARAMIATAAPSPMREPCHFGRQSHFPAKDSCTYFEGPPRVAVYGNSHGVELAYGLAGALRERGVAITHFTVTACEAGYGRMTDAYCDAFFESRLNFIEQSRELTHVVLAYRAETAGSEEIASLVGLANHLAGRGKTVVLAVQAPVLTADVSAFLRRAIRTGVGDLAALSRDDWRAINGRVYAALGG